MDDVNSYIDRKSKDLPKYFCRRCEGVFSSADELAKHTYQKHSSTDQPTQDQISEAAAREIMEHPKLREENGKLKTMIEQQRESIANLANERTVLKKNNYALERDYRSTTEKLRSADEEVQHLSNKLTNVEQKLELYMDHNDKLEATVNELKRRSMILQDALDDARETLAGIPPELTHCRYPYQDQKIRIGPMNWRHLLWKEGSVVGRFLVFESDSDDWRDKFGE